MTVGSILENKGRDVVTVEPSQKVWEAVSILHERRIGALLVLDVDNRVLGIISERDVVRILCELGAQALERQISAVMTTSVTTVEEGASIDDAMTIMTNNRFRHLPVVRDGSLVGVVSIGDVVKRRIDNADREAEDLKAYIHTA